jgi:hypothetical protein
VVDPLPSKFEALSTNPPVLPKKKKKERERGEREKEKKESNNNKRAVNFRKILGLEV